jgi:uncharacterized membrane protein
MKIFKVMAWLFQLNDSPSLPKIMDIDELAAWLKVEPNQIKRSIKREQLVAGLHYFIIDDEVRFVVNNNIIVAIMDHCAKAAQLARKIADNSKTQATVERQKKVVKNSTNNEDRKTA